MMKRWIGAFALMLMLVTLGYGQGSGPITVKEVDGSPACNNCRTIIFPNSSLTVSGNQATVASGGGSGTVNAQTGTTYTVVAGDSGKLVTFSNASSIAVTLPQATGSFTSPWAAEFENLGAGTVTITPTTSTIDGAASITLLTNQGVKIVSDGANYSTQRGGAGLQQLNALTDTWTNSGTTYCALCLNITNTASASASKAFDFQVGSTSILKLQKDGKLGINMGSSAPVRPLSVEGIGVIGKGTGTSDVSATLVLHQNNANITSYSSGNLYWGAIVNSVNGTTPSVYIGTYNGNFGVIAHHTSTNHLKFGYATSGSLTETMRLSGEGRLSLMSAATANPGTSELTSLGAASLYVKGSKFVIAYNNAGTITYITIPLDGSTSTWTHSTTAP